MAYQGNVHRGDLGSRNEAGVCSLTVMADPLSLDYKMQKLICLFLKEINVKNVRHVSSLLAGKSSWLEVSVAIAYPTEISDADEQLPAL